MNVDNNQQSSEPTISYAIICFVNSQNNETIESINNFLVNQMKNHPKLFIKEVAKMICDESLEDRIYRYLLTIFSNAISTRQRPLGFFMSQWRSIFCEDEIISLHNQLIHFLESDDFNLRVYSSWCIARLVNFELPLGIWPNFFQWLFETLLSPSFQDNIFLIDGAFRVLHNFFTMNLIVKEMPNFSFVLQSIYNVLKFYLGNPSIDLNILNDCLKVNTKVLFLLDAFFENNQNELDGYVRTLLKRMSIFNKEIHKRVYKSIIITFARHIEKLGHLMPEIFPVVSNDLAANDDEVIVMGISFWISLAQCEIDKNLHTIIKTASISLIPVFLTFLSSPNAIYKLSDTQPIVSTIPNTASDGITSTLANNIPSAVINNESNTVPNVAHSSKNRVDAGDGCGCDDEELSPVVVNIIVCLSNFVRAEPETCVPILLKFVSDSFNVNKFASFYVIFSLMKFNDFYPCLENLFPNILQTAEDKTNPALQDLALEIISDSVSTYQQIISSTERFKYLLKLVSLNISNESPVDVIVKSFGLLSNLLQAFVNDIMQSYLWESFSEVYSIFEKAFENPNFREPPLIIEVYNAFSELIMHLPKLAESKIIELLHITHQNIIDEMICCKINAPIYLSMNCNLIRSITIKIRHSIEPFVPPIMDTFYRLLSIKDFEVYSEALYTIDAFSIIMKKEFSPYYHGLSQILEELLEEFQVNKNIPLIYQVIQLTRDVFQYPTNSIIELAPKYFSLLRPLFSESSIPKYLLPSLITAITNVVAQMRYDFDSLFTSMLSILLKMQRIQIDVTQYEDTDFAFLLFESILHSYVVCVEIASGNKRLILMNIKQIFNAVELMSKYSAITQRSYDLFLKLLDDLVNYCGYSFCKTLEENPIIYQVFSLIKNLPDDDLLRKSSIVEGKIALCLQKMH